MAAALNLEGKTFGKLLIMSPLPERRHGVVMWKAFCECGNICTVNGTSVARGRASSCGCGQRNANLSHGLAYSKQYKMWTTSKYRARVTGRDFNLEPEDIVIPEVCPILGIPLNTEGGKLSNDSPSIDRFDNSKGYTKDNIRIISMKANRIKSTATVEELEAILKYMKGK